MAAGDSPAHGIRDSGDRNWQGSEQMDTMSLTPQENRNWPAPFSCRYKSWMVAGSILHACRSEADGMATVPLRAMRVLSRLTLSCTNSATWDTPRNVRACPSTANSMRSESRLRAIRDHDCRSGLYAKAGIAPPATARWNMTSTTISGPPRTPTRAFRECWNVTYKSICSVEFSPPLQPRW